MSPQRDAILSLRSCQILAGRLAACGVSTEWDVRSTRLLHRCTTNTCMELAVCAKSSRDTLSAGRMAGIHAKVIVTPRVIMSLM
jgi:hypothetical protein